MAARKGTVRYLNRAEVAARIGVVPSALARYKLPDPDAIVGPVNDDDGTLPRGTVRGWLPDTVDQWNANRPGRGARNRPHERMTIDPLGRESWAQLGITADERQATVSVSATQDERHRHRYRPTVDGNSDDLVYIDLPVILVTAHDCIRIHAFVRQARATTADWIAATNELT